MDKTYKVSPCAARYDIGLAVRGTTAALVILRGARSRMVGPWETGASSPHAAAVEAVLRACSEVLAHIEPRVIYLRQLSAIQAVTRDHGLLLSASKSTLAWRGPHDEEHPALRRALAVLGVLA